MSESVEARMANFLILFTRQKKSSGQEELISAHITTPRTGNGSIQGEQVARPRVRVSSTLLTPHAESVLGPSCSICNGYSNACIAARGAQQLPIDQLHPFVPLTTLWSVSIGSPRRPTIHQVLLAADSYNPFAMRSSRCRCSPRSLYSTWRAGW